MDAEKETGRCALRLTEARERIDDLERESDRLVRYAASQEERARQTEGDLISCRSEVDRLLALIAASPSVDLGPDGDYARKALRELNAEAESAGASRAVERVIALLKRSGYQDAADEVWKWWSVRARASC